MVQNSPESTSQFQDIADFKFNLLQSIKMLRWVGYGLLLVMLVSFIETFIPFRPMDPAWELATFRQVIERMPIPLMGLMLVYHGHKHGRAKWEKRLLPWLSRGTLVFGILLLLFIPLGLVNTFRLDDRNTAQVNQQIEQQKTQVAALQQRLDGAETAEQIAQVAVLLRRPDVVSQLSNPEQFNTVKAELNKAAKTTLSAGEQRAYESRTQARTVLLKQSAKTNLIALISSILFIGLWRFTAWARRQS